MVFSYIRFFWMHLKNWCFQNRGGSPKWMVKIMEKTLSKWTIRGVFPLFSETSKYIHLAFRVPHLLKGLPCKSPWIALPCRGFEVKKREGKLMRKQKASLKNSTVPWYP